MNVALMGSVSSSWYALDALLRSGVEVTGVLGVDESQSGRVGDYRTLRHLATESATPFLSFIKVTESAVEDFLRNHAPDLLFVIGISQLVPDDLINIASGGGIGFHPTMLPEGRGRAPVAWTIINNARAAVSLFYLTDEADAGDIVAQREVPAHPHDYSEDLIHRTNIILADVITELAPKIKTGTIPHAPQDHTRATFYEKRTPADGLIDLTATTDTIYRLIRAAGRPYPGAFTHHNGRKLTIWRAAPCEKNDLPDAAPGAIAGINDEGHPLLRLTDGGLCITEAVWEDGTDAIGQLAAGTQLG